MSDTPRTDAAATGFARILVDRETFTVTEIVPSDFARELERDLAAAQGKVERLELFVADMFRLSGWPDGGDIDGFAFQDAAEARGLLVPETRTEPCGDSCYCAEFHGDMKDGVTCYRYSPILKDAIARAALAEDRHEQ